MLVVLVAALHVSTATVPTVVDRAAHTWLAQSDAPVAAQPRKSIFELNHELADLERDRPGLGFPIAFIAIGGAGLVLDGLLFFTYYVLTTGALAYLWPVLVVIGVAALAGFAGVGFLMLGIRLKQRSNYDQRINAIRDELSGRERAGEHPYNLQPGYDAPPPPPMPPPPPPPPPSGFVPMLEPQLVLAQF